MFDCCAKGDKPWGSKYCRILDVMGLPRKVLLQGFDRVNSCVHKSSLENYMLSRCHLMLSSHLYLSCPQDLFFLCTCKQVAFRKVRRNYSLTHTHTHTHTHTYIYVYIYTYIYIYICVFVCVCEREREREREIKSTQPHWNLIGRGMTATPPVLSPRSILPSPSSHCPFIFRSKDLTRKKFVLIFIYLFIYFYFLKIAYFIL